MLLVRMMDSVSSQNAPGANFTTKLEYNLVANGVVVVPAGTIIYGKVQSSTQAGRALGRSTLDIRLAQMVARGQPHPDRHQRLPASGRSLHRQSGQGRGGRRGHRRALRAMPAKARPSAPPPAS